MGFEKLIDKVSQAEQALEARERSVGADWRQLVRSWQAAWTPGRIVVAGLASGFLVGRARPMRQVTGGGALQLMSALAGIVASGNAAAAADGADQAARAAEGADAPAMTDSEAATRAYEDALQAEARAHAERLQAHERLRRSGLV
ncbi:hypothetical protein [Luteimonas sp. e5]